jgi:aminoglycoside/choline kinase family phosphotransferase
VSSRPVPVDLLPWALSALGASNNRQERSLSVVAGDASNRRYFRLLLDAQSYVLAEAPPATEKNEAFLAVRELLDGAGVKVPALYAADLERGYLLLEDLGDNVLLPELNPDSVHGHYHAACGALRQMAALDAQRLALSPYDAELLGEELSRFADWFVVRLLGYSLDASEHALLGRLFTRLIDTALEQPRVLVHRDFHSRNLMLQANGQLAVIDFQDAVVGPVTYDLVSLLRDCYIQWPAGQVTDWALGQRDALHAEGLLPEVGDAAFLRWFDWMGLQRHIKVLGTFARLYLRDGKPAYLEDLPLVIAYVLEILDKYRSDEPVFGECLDWFESRLSPLIAQQGWGEKP